MRLRVTVIAPLSLKGVDACIAPIVRALNAGGVVTTSSCCGHGAVGGIVLEDGRELAIIRAPVCKQKRR